MPAAKAGLKVGDIVVTDGRESEIDENGNYVDPLYGKIEFTNLITARAYTGDSMPLQIQRDGKPTQLNVTLEHRNVEELCDSAVHSSIARRSITFLVASSSRSYLVSISRNGAELAKRRASTFRLQGSIPIRALSRRKPARGYFDSGSSGQQHDRLR